MASYNYNSSGNQQQQPSMMMYRGHANSRQVGGGGVYPPQPYGGSSSSSTVDKKRKTILKIILLGDSGVGKTSLMSRFHTNKFTGQYKATIGADFTSKELTLPDNNNNNSNGGVPVTLQIWDTAGQERFQSLGTSFYRGADACLLVYDVTEQKTLDHLTHWRDEFLRQIGNHDHDFPFVVLGNKMDKGPSVVSSRSLLEQWSRQRQSQQQQRHSPPIPHFETSAKTAMNVREAFMEAAILGYAQEEEKRRNNAGILFVPPPIQTIDLNRMNDGSGGQRNECCF